MTSKATELVIDCADLAGLTRFWCSVLGYEVQPECWPQLRSAHSWMHGGLAMSPRSARRSCACDRLADNVVAAAAQLVDHLLTMVERMDVHVAEAAGGVVKRTQ